ncbi:hypothetical protein K501DRAFT_253607 [Backusella circina FSU 941]|nr:hypothetical protein K501DRAFT_253607 [Backusella circina FSU 941]
MVTADELLKLIDSLKVVSADSKLQALMDAAKNGQSVDRDTVTEVVSSMLAETEGLGDLAGSIGEFDFKFM